MEILVVDDNGTVIKSFGSHNQNACAYLTTSENESYLIGGCNPTTIMAMATSAMADLHENLVEWTDLYSSEFKEPVVHCSLKQFIYSVMNELALTKPVDLTPEDIEAIRAGNISDYYMIHQEIQIDGKPVKIHGLDIDKYMDQKGKQ